MPKPTSVLPDTQVTPTPSLERRTRRKFSTDYKLRIINEADSCKHGEVGTLLRREKLYSNQLATWRREFAEHGIKGIDKSTPGPSPSKTAEQRQIAQLEKRTHDLMRKLEIANDCLELQKKVLVMFDHLRNGSKV